jgi:hypothetical protein
MLLDGMGAIQLGQKYSSLGSSTAKGVTQTGELFMYDYGKRAWLPVPGFAR